MDYKLKGCYLEKVDLVYVVGLSIFIITTLLESVQYCIGVPYLMLFIRSCRFFSYSLFIVEILLKKKIYKCKFNVLLFIVFLLLISVLMADNNSIFLYGLIIFASQETSGQLVIKTVLICQIIVLSIVVLMSQVGIIEDIIGIEGSRVRHFLGFDWASFAPVLFLFIIFEILYIKKGKINFTLFFLLSILSYWFYCMTRTRFAFLLSSFALVFFVFFGKILLNKKKLYLFKNFYKAIPFAVSMVGVLLCGTYSENNKFSSKLNIILNNRLQLGRDAIDNYGITPFGQIIKWIGQTGTKGVYNYVDCSYVQIMLQYGVIFLVLVILAYTIIMRKALENNQYYIIVIVSFIMIFSITEPRLVNLAFNPFLLLCVVETVDYEKKKDKKALCQ